MNPIDFVEKTKVLQKPPILTDEECGPMAVWNGDNEKCISCWKGNFMDKLRFLFTGKIWIWVWFGKTQPPVYCGTESPFQNVKPMKGE